MAAPRQANPREAPPRLYLPIDAFIGDDADVVFGRTSTYIKEERLIPVS
jgi:hypothetical protein